MKRWSVWGAVLILTLLSALLTSAWAKEEFPSRPITFLVGYAPGGSADIQARLLAELVSKHFGQRVIAEHKPGMNAAIMLNYLVRQKADGYAIATAPGGAIFGNQFTMKVEYKLKDIR